MKTIIYVQLVAILLLFSTSSAGVKPQAELNWISFEDAVLAHGKQPKKIIIDLYTDWCGWCKKMDQNTYSNPNIINYVNQNFYAVKFNAEQREDVLFNNHTFKFIPSGNRGYHELAAALTQNKLSYPTTVFMDEEMRIIQPIPGYLDAPTFEKISHYIGDNHFKKTDWEEYQKNFKSSL